MKSWKMIMVAALAVIAVALITTSAFAYLNNGLGFFGSRNGMMGGSTPSGYSPMNGYPQATYPTQPGVSTQTTVPPQYGGWGCGGCPMRSGWYGSTGPYYTSNVSSVSPITIDAAVTIAKGYLTSLNNPDLTIGQVEEYTLNFYVMYCEKSTGIGAFEMLIDKYTGNIYPEMGPNMMWNTKYGMMSGNTGMMGGWRVTPSTPMTVSIDQAKTLAQQFLDTNYQGTTVGDVQPFYGYYTVEVLLSGNTYGMLSVNGYTGQVWYHTWHGTFIQEWKP